MGTAGDAAPTASLLGVGDAAGRLSDVTVDRSVVAACARAQVGTSSRQTVGQAGESLALES